MALSGPQHAVLRTVLIDVPRARRGSEGDVLDVPEELQRFLLELRGAVPATFVPAPGVRQADGHPVHVRLDEDRQWRVSGYSLR